MRQQLSPSTIRIRTGATLVEVLMALLVMAIGVTSVFTLFPLALLKSVKANQLTNAKLYENSIRELVLTSPQLITGAPTWDRNTTYGAGAGSGAHPFPSRWAAPQSEGRVIPETNEIFFAVPNAGLPGPPYVSGTKQPTAFITTSNWRSYTGTALNPVNPGGYQVPTTRPFRPGVLSDGNILWYPYKHSPFPLNNTLTTTTSYFVDPLGWYRSVAAYQTHFGLVDYPEMGSPPAKPPTADNLLLDRIHCQLTVADADTYFRLSDSWNVVLEKANATVTLSPAAPAAPTAMLVDFPDVKPELLDANNLGGGTHRMVLSSTLSQRSIAVAIAGAVSNPTSNQIQVAINATTLPRDFRAFAATVDQVRIEVQSPSRYSWLMAVQMGPRGQLEAQVAIVFNRTFEFQDERGIRAEFCPSEDTNGNDVLDPGEDDMWVNGRLDRNLAKIMWPVGADAPRYKEGSYILDASHGVWYQITKVLVDSETIDANDSTAGTGYLRTILQLGTEVKYTTGDNFADYLLFNTALSPNNNPYYSSAVLMPGVVHVFPIVPE